MDETKRRIVTINSSSGAKVPFRFANLSGTQLASLAPTATQQQKIIAYLRGGNTYGGQFIEGTGIGQFRERSGPLGDISNAQAVIVPPTATLDTSVTPNVWVPTLPYDDATDPGYSTYALGVANRTRGTRIVAAANDGMVHVFDAGPVNPVAAGGGQEVYAFIPKALFRGVAGAKATEDTTAIQALTYQDGGVPIYKHHMYVDSSPRVADVDFGNGSGDWHTIIVGGLGKGGNSYYALDATNADATDEADRGREGPVGVDRPEQRHQVHVRQARSSSRRAPTAGSSSSPPATTTCQRRRQDLLPARERRHAAEDD